MISTDSQIYCQVIFNNRVPDFDPDSRTVYEIHPPQTDWFSTCFDQREIGRLQRQKRR